MTETEIDAGLARSIEAAEIEELPEQPEQEEGGSFRAIVRDIVKGNTDQDEVEERLVAWANDVIDIPLVPESLEGRIFSALKGLLKRAATEAADQYLK